MSFRQAPDKEEYWITIADLMTGLMLIFLFIAISYMSKISDENEKFIDIVNAYKTIQDQIYTELLRTFQDDLEVWHGSIDRETLSISFYEPEVLFEKGKIDLKPKFQAILEDFFPRYISTLSKSEFKNNINSIRIEGHTSSEWLNTTRPKDAYIYNMSLSQSRTAEVLNFVLKLKSL